MRISTLNADKNHNVLLDRKSFYRSWKSHRNIIDVCVFAAKWLCKKRYIASSATTKSLLKWFVKSEWNENRVLTMISVGNYVTLILYDKECERGRRCWECKRTRKMPTTWRMKINQDYTSEKKSVQNGEESKRRENLHDSWKFIRIIEVGDW